MMTERMDDATSDARPVNRTLVPDNACFGCGMEHPDGLRLEVRRDPAHQQRLSASFTPRERFTVFRGIVHGGVLFTAMGCLAGWVPTVLMADEPRVWVLRSADGITFHRPAPSGRALQLTGTAIGLGGVHDPARVRVEVLDEEGRLVAEGEFTLIALAAARFDRLAERGALTPGWRAYLGLPGGTGGEAGPPDAR